jgi:hypothetical protein
LERLEAVSRNRHGIVADELQPGEPPRQLPTLLELATILFPCFLVAGGRPAGGERAVAQDNGIDRG